VKYRGTQWTVILAPDTLAEPGAFRVQELVGSRLRVTKA
jgi:hypothetical protein